MVLRRRLEKALDNFLIYWSGAIVIASFVVLVRGRVHYFSGPYDLLGARRLVQSFNRFKHPAFDYLILDFNIF